MPSGALNRRALLLGLAAGALASCTTQAELRHAALQPNLAGVSEGGFDPAVIYAAGVDHGQQMPAVNYRKLHPDLLRQRVYHAFDAMPGTVIISLQEFRLYVLERDGTAIRYGVGIGKAGYAWTGRASIDHQSVWPGWTPPAEMVDRLPELAAHRGGMPGGLANPLGARARYIYRGGHDTLYRVHGTPEWWSIGRAASSGCIRMINQDVIDLALRVPDHADIVVL